MEWEALLDSVVRRSQRSKERKQDRSKRTEQQILSAALRVFSRVGISRARIADIAAEAGISASTVYEYYKGKEDLAYEVPTAYLTMFYEEFAVAVAGKALARERLYTYLWLSADFARRHPEWARLFYLEIWPSVFVSETELKHSVDDFARIVIFLIRQGCEDGEWSAGYDPYQTAAIMLGGCNQLIITWLLYRRPRNLSKASVDLVERLLLMLESEKVKPLRVVAKKREAIGSTG